MNEVEVVEEERFIQSRSRRRRRRRRELHRKDGKIKGLRIWSVNVVWDEEKKIIEVLLSYHGIKLIVGVSSRTLSSLCDEESWIRRNAA